MVSLVILTPNSRVFRRGSLREISSECKEIINVYSGKYTDAKVKALTRKC